MASHHLLVEFLFIGIGIQQLVDQFEHSATTTHFFKCVIGSGI